MMAENAIFFVKIARCGREIRVEKIMNSINKILV
jgi:hypothetical protein